MVTSLGNLSLSDLSLGSFLKLKREALFKRGGSLVDLSMINLDLQVPRIGLDALTESVLAPLNHRYTIARGVKRAREAFSRKYENFSSQTFNPETEILITSGTKDALMLFLSSVTTPGDSVLCLSPTYPVFAYVAEFLGLRIVSCSLEDIEHNSQKYSFVKAILLNTPNNPLGVSYEGVEKILSHFNDIPVFNDFIYGELYSGPHGEKAQSLHHLKGRKYCIESYSLSKAYAVSGWRIGGVVGDASIVQMMADKKSQIDYGVFLPIQTAAATLLDKGQSIVSEHAFIFKSRARTVMREIGTHGYETGLPFVWATFDMDVTNAVLRLLYDEGICILPGAVFGSQYRNCVRVALVKNDDVLSRSTEKFLRCLSMERG